MKNFEKIFDDLENNLTYETKFNILRLVGLFLASFVSIIISLEIALMIANIILGEPYNASLGSVVMSFHYVIIIFILCLIGVGYTLLRSKDTAKSAYHIDFLNPVNFKNREEQDLYILVEKLSKKFSLDKVPSIGIYQSEDLNAFATGPSSKNSMVVFSSQLINQMDESDIAAVAAHEIAHIANGDMINMSVIIGAVRAVAILIQIPVTMITFVMGLTEKEKGGLPWITWICVALQWVIYKITMLIGSLIMNYFSRRREYLADKLSARTLGSEYMINALEKLKKNREIERTMTKKQKEICMFNITAVDSIFEIFSTHPTLEKRIKRLVELPK